MKKLLPIETKRLILRDYVPSDWPEVHKYASDPLAVRYLPFGPNTPSQTRAFVRKMMAWKLAKPRRNFAVALILKSENRLIGGCRLGLQDGTDQIASMGYLLNRKYWGKGYATEAARALIRFGFSKLRLHRIWATCDVRNKASARVLEKLGMKREAHFRQNVLQKGRWRDSYLYAILRK